MNKVIKNKMVAICGSKSAGKDSFALSLYKQSQQLLGEDSPNFYNMKFATRLNLILNDAIGVEVAYEDRDEPIQVPREVLAASINRYSEGFVVPADYREDTTWRELAQYVGTHIFRAQDPNFFVNSEKEAVAQILTSDPQAVVLYTDPRFANELSLADVVVGVTRDDVFKLEVAKDLHPSERLGEAIDVLASRYLAYRDAGDESTAEYWYNKLYLMFERLGFDQERVQLIQSSKDAEGVIVFKDLATAFNYHECDLTPLTLELCINTDKAGNNPYLKDLYNQ